MEKYNDYKDSQIPFVGVVPSDWIITKFKFVGNIQGRIGFRGYTVQDIVIKGEGAITLSPSNIKNQNLTLTDCTYLSWEKYEESPEIKVYGGDIVVVKTGSTIGKVAIVKECQTDYPMTLNPQLIVIKEIKLDPKFLYYLMVSQYFQSQFEIYSAGGSTPAISQEKINNFSVVHPSKIEEQRKIGNYLDYKTTQVDKLVTDKQKLIELLNEERTAIINHAVTKGIIPDIPMKDSGIDWLGELPIEWKTSKLKYHTHKIIDGAHFTPTYIDDANGVPFLRVTDIHHSSINLNEVKRIPLIEHTELIKRCKPELGDVLLSKNGTIGVMKIVDWEWEFSIFVSLCLLKFKNDLLNKFFIYFFDSNIAQQQISEGSQKTSVTNLHLEKIKELIIPIPSINEQQGIVDHLDEECQRIDAIIKKVKYEINFLKEYKTALISEVITGKVDVRNEVLTDLTAIAS